MSSSDCKTILMNNAKINILETLFKIHQFSFLHRVSSKQTWEMHVNCVTAYQGQRCCWASYWETSDDEWRWSWFWRPSRKLAEKCAKLCEISELRVPVFSRLFNCKTFRAADENDDAFNLLSHFLLVNIRPPTVFAHIFFVSLIFMFKCLRATSVFSDRSSALDADWARRSCGWWNKEESKHKAKTIFDQRNNRNWLLRRKIFLRMISAGDDQNILKCWDGEFRLKLDYFEHNKLIKVKKWRKFLRNWIKRKSSTDA